MRDKVVLETNLNGIYKPLRGKVRDIYDLGEKLLIVTTDRISAYDHILPNGIPNKGIVLNKISEFWFKKTKSIIRNHFLTSNFEEFPYEFQLHREEFDLRSMIVKKVEPIPVECIVRGYISGSGWIDYTETGSVSGISLPENLVESSILDKPIFTPSTKADLGTHDENISLNKVKQMVGNEIAEKIKEVSISIYKLASKYAYDKGIIIADTKFEFGIDYDTGEIILIDEVLTPDSSRFWPRDEYEPGRAQNSFDKQFVRDYLNSINWDRKPPVPVLPPDIVQKTKEKYLLMLKYFDIDE